VNRPAQPALFDALPRLAGRVPWASLGDWPTPVDRLAGLDELVGGELWVKRDDLSASRYGGNKVRTLEALFGLAAARGATRIWATGAYGSNHALATVLHARAAGLEPGVMLFPQPHTACAHENLVATLSARPAVRPLRSWATLPFAILGERRRSRDEAYVMVPGGAIPHGALGYVSAVFELARQIEAGAAPAPARIVLGVGSTCTTAGLLAGTAIAARLGVVVGDAAAPPAIWAVRVTPWPVTSRRRVVSLAARAAAFVAELTGDPRLAIPRAELAARLRVIGGHIGRGYGHVTPDGLAAIERFRRHGGPPLDTVYSGKAAAGLLARPDRGPVLFWATKSSRPLPPVDPGAIAAAPPRMRRWLDGAVID
jgi:1-aminocyclopropane-1-carboxylate deaminase/D-cysteine desulfhydrase-like pyridoxal-dependent ACC family enzyme